MTDHKMIGSYACSCGWGGDSPSEFKMHVEIVRLEGIIEKKNTPGGRASCGNCIFVIAECDNYYCKEGNSKFATMPVRLSQMCDRWKGIE